MSARGSRAGFTAPASRATRRTSGICGQHPKVLALPFRADIRRPDRDNTIDVYISDEYEDVLADGAWQNFFTARPEP